MESVTKRKLTAAEIGRISEKAFGCGCAQFEELNEGWANSAYKLELADGRLAVLKVAAESEEGRMRCERGLMRTEVEAMRRIQALGTVPLPDIYSYDDSRTIVPCEYFLMENLTGTTYDKAREELSEEIRVSIDTRLGGYFRQIHGIEGREFGYYLPNASNGPAWDGVFIALMHDVMQDGRDAGVELPMAYEELGVQLELCRDALREVKTPRLIHWDSWPGNVFVRDGQAQSLIDFERALWADPLMEYGFGKFGYSPAFEAGYKAADAAFAPRLPEGSERSQAVRRALYPMYLDLVMRVECDYRGFGSDHTQWAHDNLRDGWERFLQAEKSV
ncbi:phosphotransferase family protein [Saccharibacillus deserti]|uniref:phosphotransferase family protein n=1 Tax=Saccharibacillus deserti TaxID=1634444 RepID=UPI001555CEF6|nr:aminoglycoside phosphotransferase family protein [Saccharibacillus deserti]